MPTPAVGWIRMAYDHFVSWRDLERFGIKSLTGEACGIGIRMLCDLTEDGKKLVESFLRVECNAHNWNSGAVASVMLPYGILKELTVYCVLSLYSYAIVVNPYHVGGVCGTDEEKIVEKWRVLMEDAIPIYHR